MTTIVYRDGVLAADTRAYSGGHTPIGKKSKIRRLADGSLVGVSSTEPGVGEAIIGALQDHDSVLEARDDLLALGDKLRLQGLLVRPNGDVFYFSDSPYPSGPLRDEFFAIGSGQEYALGALSVGVSAKEAVKVASLHDAWTNDEIEVLEIQETKEKAV